MRAVYWSRYSMLLTCALIGHGDWCEVQWEMDSSFIYVHRLQLTPVFYSLLASVPVQSKSICPPTITACNSVRY